MRVYKSNWLPHLKHSIPKEVFGYSTSMYSIALEGWRRGLTLRFINKNQMKAQTEFILSNKNRRYRFSGSRGNIISKEAINICTDKYITKGVLKKSGIPVVDGERFHKNIKDEEIVHYVEEFGYPVVLKPHNGNGGEGVIVDIQDESTLRDALVHVRQTLKYSTVLIERYIPSQDYQLYIIEDKVVAAFERVPAFIIGDGKRSINQLINKKNAQRRKNPGLYQHLIDKKDKTLQNLIEKQGYFLEDIPLKNEKIYLSIKSNISVGGEVIDKTEQLPNKVKSMAINAAKSIPNLPICAVELIVERNSRQSYVLELKTQPTISSHLFPNEGTARDVPKEIIDYLFPESKSVERDTLHYFDFYPVFNAFYENYIQEYTLPNIQKDKNITKRIMIEGLKNRMEFIKSIRPKLIELRLNGFFKYRRKGKLELVVVGPVQKLEKINSIIGTGNGLENDNINITTHEWHRPVKVGFEIKGVNDKSRKKKLQEYLYNRNKKSNDKPLEAMNPLDKIIATIKNISIQ